MTFAEKLQKLRHWRTFTQEELARAAGISVTAVRDMEQGRCCPSLRTAVKLTAVLKVSLETFRGCFGD
jgi:DNA-binding XRE family transcriptional regulator